LKSQKNPFEQDLNTLSDAELSEDQQFGKDAKAAAGEHLSSDIATDTAKSKNKKWWKF
jgi:DNA helicase-2/ATP-dependent DNA helicase PcrA